MPQLFAATRELLADTDTPVSAYAKLCAGRANTFLFESGETLEGIGRYSIVAWDPLASLRLTSGEALLQLNGGETAHPWQEFFPLARRLSAEMTCPGLPELPFVGSLMGYVGYDAVRLIERLGDPPHTGLPIADLCYPSRFAVFDHIARRLTLVAIAYDSAGAEEKLSEIQARLRDPLVMDHKTARVEIEAPPKERYMAAVRAAKEHILAGDIFQVVLSDRFRGRTDIDPLAVYRWLRVKSPSPYMFYLRYPGCTLVGASPETLVRLEGGRVIVRPIAGTRGRGKNPREDQELEQELLASEKERAEHVMLVDLARNDVGRVAAYGSVEVEPYMTVERFSHVMHLTSQVEGDLGREMDAWDVFQAAFPAGTVSGAPKVRAMEIIDDLEHYPRGPYAGAVGCFGPGPRMDTCIAIRTMQFSEGEFILQTGAGIVADSIPEMEYQEISHKAAQGLAALELAAEAKL